jgi:hypothetical protein
MSTPPAGQIGLRKAPAIFSKVDEVAPLLDVSLKEKRDSLDVVVRYGDRKTAITLTR